MLYLIEVLRAPLGSWFPGEDVDVFRGDTWEGKKTGLVIPWLGLLGEEEAARGQASGDREGQALSHRPPERPQAWGSSATEKDVATCLGGIAKSHFSQ